MAKIPSVNLHLNLVEDQWFLALRIPVTEFPHYSRSYRRWLAYLGFAITACEGVLRTSEDVNSAPVDLDSTAPIETYLDYYYHHEGEICAVDPDLERQSTSATSQGSGHRGRFRDTLIERDTTCVVTSAPVTFCDAAHMIRFVLGSEYIKEVTTKRQDGDDPVIEDINDARNGFLVNTTLHRVLGQNAAFLQVPNSFMQLWHMNPANPESSDHSPPKFYLHYFSTDRFEQFPSFNIPHNACARRPRNLEKWPTHTIFALIYGSVALNSFCIRTSECMEVLRKKWGSKFYSSTVGNKRDGDLSQLIDKREADGQNENEMAGQGEERAASQPEAEEAMIFVLMIRKMIAEGNEHKAEGQRNLAEQRWQEEAQAKVQGWLENVQ